MRLEHHAFTAAAGDGTVLNCERWKPGGEIRAGVMLVHGVGEHIGRYDRVVKALTERGMEVHGWDLRGHGKSGGRRGHVVVWADYLEDLALRIRLARMALAAGTPLYLLGHSLGALVALEGVLSRAPGVDGLILSGAPLDPIGVAKPNLVKAARWLSRVWPTFRLRLPMGPDMLTRDEAKLAEMANDPLRQNRVTARWATEAMAAVDRVNARLGEVRLPLLVLHGGLDGVNHKSGAERLVRAAASHDKTLRIYPETRHEPHNDVQHVEVLRDLSDWLEQRTGRPQAAESLTEAGANLPVMA